MVLLSKSLEATQKFIAASCRPGYEKSVFRIQGFVLGALLITVIDLIYTLYFESSTTQSKIHANSWAIAIVFALVYAWIVASIDQYEKEPWSMLLVGLLWGSVVSAAMAKLLNETLQSLPSIAPEKIAPFTEEFSKGAILLLFLLYVKDEFDDALDGLIYGAMVGIGFAMTENAGNFYVYAPGADFRSLFHNPEFVSQFILRCLLQGLAGHATYTALTGLGFGLSRQTRRRALKVIFPILGIASAILAHALWNQKPNQGIPNSNQDVPPSIPVLMARVALINGPFLISVIIAIILAWHKEAKVIKEQLKNELEQDHAYITLEMMLTFKGRSQACWKMLKTKGPVAWWRLRKLQRTYIELAFSKWRGKDKNEICRRIKALRDQLGI